MVNTITTRGTRVSGEQFVFQRANATVRIVKIVKNYFHTNNIEVFNGRWDRWIQTS